MHVHGLHRLTVALEHALGHIDHMAGHLGPSGLLLITSSVLIGWLHR